jgi:hypothetical protein
MTLGPFSTVANVVDFRIQFDRAVQRYEERVEPWLEAWRRKADPEFGDRPVVDAELEAHIRTYVIDPLLAALNWTTDENLAIEVLVRSKSSENRRRLDYLGVEADTLQPLLVVEAKRVKSPLPQPATITSSSRANVISVAPFTVLGARWQLLWDSELQYPDRPHSM